MKRLFLLVGVVFVVLLSGCSTDSYDELRAEMDTLQDDIILLET